MKFNARYYLLDDVNTDLKMDEYIKNEIDKYRSLNMNWNWIATTFGNSNIILSELKRSINNVNRS